MVETATFLFKGDLNFVNFMDMYETSIGIWFVLPEKKKKQKTKTFPFAFGFFFNMHREISIDQISSYQLL